MDKTAKYLAALEPTEATEKSFPGPQWPEGIPAIAQPKPEHPLEYQFLDDDSIGHYLSRLKEPWIRQSEGLPNGAPRPQPPFVDFAALGRDWTADTFPLALCEFLAYKSGLAYRSPRRIRHDLLGIDAKGRRYKEGMDQFAFFDTSQPCATVRYTDTQAFAFVHHGTGYLIFRGTTGLSDWYTNLTGELTSESYRDLDPAPQTLVGAPRPARHTGFATAWGSVAPDMEAWVKDQLHHRRIDKIVLSGHSLGGALAFLGAYHFAHKSICRVHAVITFGAPKVGGEEFAAAYENPQLGLKDRTLRIEASGDIVAQMSRGGVDKHVGHQWAFNKRPLRPIWQMMLMSPRDVIAKNDAEADSNSTKNGGEESTSSSSGRGSNSNSESEPELTWRMYILQLLLAALWYIAKSLIRVLAAHSVETRYGLYISTLSYQRIRKYHSDQARLTYMLRRGQENERIINEGAFVGANADLALHLGVVRGRHPRTFSYLAKRPIRIHTPAKLGEYKKKFINYIA